MRLKELRGLPVIDPTAARKIGTVSDYQVDPVGGRLAALDITPVDGTQGQRVLAQRIRRVGSSAVILTARGGTMPNEATDVHDHWLDTSTTVGLEVMGDDGTRIGHLVDGTFNQDTLEVEAYVLRTSFWEQFLDRRGRIQPEQVHSCSRELMIVGTSQLKAAEAATVEATPAAEPLAAAETPLPAAETSVPAAEEPIPPAEEPLPMKEADRAAVPKYKPARDGRPVGTAP